MAGMVYIENIETINEIKRGMVLKCIEIAKQHPNKVQKLIIFGSSVRDDCTVESDVDICLHVIGTTRCMEMYELCRDLCYACDHNCDILKYDRLNDRFRKEVDTKGVVVYEKE